MKYFFKSIRVRINFNDYATEGESYHLANASQWSMTNLQPYYEPHDTWRWN